MSYSDCTFKDKNPVKRWLQSHRLIDAIALVEGKLPPPLIAFLISALETANCVNTLSNAFRMQE